MPSELVLTTRCVLMAGLVTVIVAPATTAPLESVTAPVISPVGTCGHRRQADRKTITNRLIAESSRTVRVVGVLNGQYTPSPVTQDDAQRDDHLTKQKIIIRRFKLEKSRLPMSSVSSLSRADQVANKR